MLVAENAQFHQARYKLYSIASSDVSVSDASVIAADADVLALARDVFPISCDAGVLEECRIAENLLGESNLTFGKIYRAYHGQIYQSTDGGRADLARTRRSAALLY